TYHFDAHVSSDGEDICQQISDIFATAHRVDEYEMLSADNGEGGIHVPHVFHPIHSSKTKLGERHFNFSLSADSHNLYVYVDCNDDLDGEDEDGESTHCVRIYVDGRETDSIGRGGYGKGVGHITLIPAHNNALNVQSSNDMNVEAVCDLTSTGYRIDVALPWEEFVVMDEVPSVFGFNIRMSSTVPTDQSVTHLSWTGRGKSDRDPSSFGKGICFGFHSP
ncbi:MAG: sugar-binding protein, partial [Planctomycetota bacterium]